MTTTSPRVGGRFLDGSNHPSTNSGIDVRMSPTNRNSRFQQQQQLQGRRRQQLRWTVAIVLVLALVATTITTLNWIRRQAQVSLMATIHETKNLPMHEMTNFSSTVTSSQLQQAHDLNMRLELELSAALLHQQQAAQPPFPLPETKRIALMFVGAPRTVTQLGVLTSHIINVIDALGAGGRDIVDVFVHLTVATTDATSRNGVLQNLVEPFTDHVLEQIRLLWNPVQVILHHDGSCSGLNGTLANHSCCTYPWKEDMRDKYQANFLQFAFLRDSYRSVRRYERDNNVEYDWFVRMRPDVGCFEPLPAVRSLSTRRYYLVTKERREGRSTNDYLFLVPRTLAAAFFEAQIMAIFELFCPRGKSFWPSEATMFYAPPALPYQALAFPCVHVMGPYQAQCGRFRRRYKDLSVSSVYEIDGTRFDQDHQFVEGCRQLVEEGYFANGTNHVLRQFGRPTLPSPSPSPPPSDLLATIRNTPVDSF